MNELKIIKLHEVRKLNYYQKKEDTINKFASSLSILIVFLLIPQ